MWQINYKMKCLSAFITNMRAQQDSGGRGHRDAKSPESPLEIPLSDPPKYAWESSWLKGNEYQNMLANMDLYCERFGFRKHPQKTHPEMIYAHPENGSIYFVKARSIGSEFGFPRVQTKKQFRWKKMNFRTELPKKNPAVVYIVASAVRCERQAVCASQSSIFRMHVVMRHKREEDSSYVLCHIRQLDITEEKRAPERRDRGSLLPCEVSSLQACLLPRVDYLNLFKWVHNMGGNHNNQEQDS